MKDKTILEVTDLDQLQALVETPVICEFQLDDTLVRLPCRRLPPKIQEQVEATLREAIPPWNEKRKEYDLYDPNYLRARALNEGIARALIVYYGCPAIAAKATAGGKPAPADKKAIYEFVQGLLSEAILELIAATVTKGGVSVRERADFTSPPASDR